MKCPQMSTERPERTVETWAAQLECDGFAGPLEVCSGHAIARIRTHLDATVFRDGRGVEMRHLECRVLYDLCHAEPLLDALRQVLGDNVLLWRSRLFVKEPGGKGVPWHTDRAYFDGWLEPPINVTAWIALDDVDEGNGCLRFMPGSHHVVTPHVRANGDTDPLFGRQAAPESIDERLAVAMKLHAGQCVLFNEAVLHSSAANGTQRRRAGLAARFTIPSVKIGGKGVATVQVAGRDDSHLNKPANPLFIC